MNNETTLLTGPPRLLSVTQFCQKHEWATQGGIRHLLFNREMNGFDRCVVRLGRKILLNEAAVFEWLKESENHV
ncbi:MAG TPA: hypothetical protein PLC40_00945 [Candidatus Hydrogenedentes bacterium]|nr:hypothetical protein [Candidatus Hydrogenedentota bacterium]